MFYNVFSIFSFNEIDYLTYINLWMLFLYYWIITFFVVIVSSLLIRSSILFVNDSWLEFILTLFSLWLVLLIISPLFIMFIDYDSILLSSLLVYSLGYQWSWSFNLNGVFKELYNSFSLYNSSLKSEALNSSSVSNSLSSINISFDHFLVPSINSLSNLSYLKCEYSFVAYYYSFVEAFVFSSYNSFSSKYSSSFIVCSFSYSSSFSYLFNYDSFSLFSFSLFNYDCRVAFRQSAADWPAADWPWFSNNSLTSLTLAQRVFGSSTSYLVYFISLNTILLLPCYLGFRFLIFSFDVIHSLGFYSLGFKIDAIPGRINYSFELSTLFKGEHRGFCYELCGTSHSSMLILAMSL